MNRLSVVELVYHQPEGERGVAVESRFARNLVSTEQMYHRRITVTEEWQPIDGAWIKQAGMMVLSNDEGRFTVQPTQEERDAANEKIVEVGSDGMKWLARPGESIRAEPSDLSAVHVRCRKGSARCTLSLFPP